MRRRHDPSRLVDAARRQGVRDQRVLTALAGVPRAAFVPAGGRGDAYVDRPVPLADGQTTSQPSLIAQMVEALELSGDEHVLEVGTGHGFQTALLAALARRVTSVERHPALAAAARDNLDAHGSTGVEVVVGDGTEGWPQAAPFDAVVVSAASPGVPPPLADQLLEGGRMVIPLAGRGYDEVVRLRKRGGRLVDRALLSAARFVPLTGRHGSPS